MKDLSNKKTLQKLVEVAGKETAVIDKQPRLSTKGNTVIVPGNLKPLFDAAQQTVREYFKDLKRNPEQGTIEINDQRYVLVRASALSKDFLNTIQKLYADRGEDEALSIGKNFLYDISHVIGMNDARNFHVKMNLSDPIAKLSAGPVHFAYSGWAFVEILPESSPTADENFLLVYNHPYSFEADSWKRSDKKANTPVCIMNAGYSSGWCEESFGIELTAFEITCTAKGDKHCTFVMAPPHKIQNHLKKFERQTKKKDKRNEYKVPAFFDRKRVEEEMQKSRILAEESAKSKADFVANMSHELRTPLGAIIGFTDLLKKTKLNKTQKDYLEAINSSGNNLLAIINDILDLSKLDANKFIIEKLPFSIKEVVHAVQVMFAAKAKDKKLRFTCNVDKSINYFVLGDPVRLKQILINLINNAIKFTDRGWISVYCYAINKGKENVEIHFSIKDTGIGIANEKLAFIFERFTQADTNTTRKYGGTGLGLAITRQLVEVQGGTITVTSKENTGSDFRFIISYKKLNKEERVLEKVNSAEEIKNTLFKRILLVEDHLMNQKLARIILENNGFDVTIAEDGRKAVDILKKKNFDVILMDIEMPVMDGYEATCIIRDRLHIQTPIIAMTAHALKGEKNKCIHAGMNDYLPKPFSEIDLVTKISTWANSKPLSAGANKTSTKIIDLSFLKKQIKNNDGFIAEMISIFKQQNPKEINALEKAVKEKNFFSVYKKAHTLRNSISFFGLNKLLDKELKSIEKLSRSNKQIDKIAAQFLKVKSVCMQAIAELEMHDRTE